MVMTFRQTAVLMLVLFGCGKSSLREAEVKTLLQQAQLYPKEIQHRIYCNDEATAKLTHDKGLVEQGYVTAQLSHTPNDVGTPLIRFTAKAEPYLLATSDTLKSIDAQLVKAADEVFHEVTNVQYASDGRTALVTYTTKMENLTPFAVLVPGEMKNELQRRASFVLTKNGWEWDKRLRK